jgi:hypothetical protein
VAALVVEADAELAPPHIEAELLGQGQHPGVVGRDRVVVAVHADAAEQGAAGQAAERPRRLVHGHAHAGCRELVRQAEAEQAAADDADAAHDLALAAT